jgi:hypothetical protein
MSFLPTRRNTSFAGLGPIPEPPADLREALALLCVTAPEVTVQKESVIVLQGNLAESEECYQVSALVLCTLVLYTLVLYTLVLYTRVD